MHDSRHTHLLGSLSDQLLNEYGDAMHAAVNNKPLRVNPAKAPKAPKAAPAPGAVTPQKKLKAKPQGKGFFAWLFS